jgi:endonuclease/exonuclease/phosphatase family metal-dependent hydrolase
MRISSFLEKISALDRILFDTLIVVFLTTTMDANAADYKAMSFNIRYGTANDGDNHWDKRKHVVAKIIRMHQPDVVGMQEVLKFQEEYLAQHCPGYAHVGVGRDDGKNKGEMTPVFYRTDRFTWVSSATLWLSDTPEVVGSKTWDNDLPRIVTYVVLKDNRTGQELVFASTHFSHMSENHRRKSADFLRKQLPEITQNRPTILVGDFNATVNSAAYKTLVDNPANTDGHTYIDTFIAATPAQQEQTGTFGGFTGTPSRASRIDWILCSDHFVPQTCQILKDNIAGRYPSDHYPILAELDLKQP